MRDAYFCASCDWRVATPHHRHAADTTVLVWLVVVLLVLAGVAHAETPAEAPPLGTPIDAICRTACARNGPGNTRAVIEWGRTGDEAHMPPRVAACACNEAFTVTEARAESVARWRCYGRCRNERERASIPCDEDFARSRCTGTTADGIYACNVGVRETLDRCKREVVDVAALCERTCDETTPEFDEVWRAPEDPTWPPVCAVPPMTVPPGLAVGDVP